MTYSNPFSISSVACLMLVAVLHVYWSSSVSARLVISVVAPEKSQFSLGISSPALKVFDRHEVPDYRELEYILESSPPRIVKSRKLLVWGIYRPKLAVTYRLLFQLVRREK